MLRVVQRGEEESNHVRFRDVKASKYYGAFDNNGKLVEVYYIYSVNPAVTLGYEVQYMCFDKTEGFIKYKRNTECYEWPATVRVERLSKENVKMVLVVTM